MNMTYDQLCALSDDEQLLSERIALIMSGEKCGEDEAREIATGAQMGLFTDKKGK